MAKPLTNKFQCEFCFKQISRKKSLNEHIKKIHKEQKLVMCELCEKTFTNNQYLRIHLKCVHEEEKNFKCESRRISIRSPILWFTFKEFIKI